MKRIKNLNVKVKIKIGKSEAGYFHIPIIHVSWGIDAFVVCIMCISLIVSWDVVEVTA